ncbi:MAG: hypothetical protein QOH06_5190 [Acidobacteriota bacterium]|jgi:hypothetical protein|nr:hypothetical protein [Acidobacteriota bacterium]
MDLTAFPGGDLVQEGLADLARGEDSDSAHGRYNALVRRLVSFESAAECAGFSSYR